MNRLNRWLALVGLCAVCGCGQPSETVLVEMAAVGRLPSGLSSARMTFEELRVLVAVPGQGPQWQVLLGDEQGGRTFDLAQASSAELVAEADVPRGQLLALEVSLDTDEPVEPGVLPVAGATTVQLPLSVAEADSARLLLQWDLTQCVAVDAQGNASLSLSPTAGVTP